MAHFVAANSDDFAQVRREQPDAPAHMDPKVKRASSGSVLFSIDNGKMRSS